MNWLSQVCLTGLLLAVFNSALVTCKPVTNEDIKDSIIAMFRFSKELLDKLNRHERREMTLGDQLKGALSSIDRRQKNQDQVLHKIDAALEKLQEKILSMETAVKTTELEKGAYTIETVDSQMKNIKDKVDHYLVVCDGQITDLKKSMDLKLDSISSEMRKLVELAAVQNNDQTSIQTTNNKLESLLKQQSEWLNAVILNLEDQRRIISEIQSSVDDGAIREVQAIKHELNSHFEAELKKLEKNMMQLHKMLNLGQESILKTLSDNTQMATMFNDVIQRNYEEMSTEVKALGRVEKLLVKTADNVMDSRKMIDYGIQQVLISLVETVGAEGKELNRTMNKRFDGMAEVILESESGGVANLSTKIETEISQVWRQIGIMYNQLTASAGALDVLQQQTGTYVNGSLQTMESMDGKVGLITSRMSEVDENLNYLLGRFSLVTHEFNQIKNSLGTALDDMRDTFKSVQNKIDESSPGPKPIEPDPEPTF